MDYKRILKGILRANLVGVLIGYSSCTLASAFYVPLYSAADMGNAFAGGAAIAQDASTNYSNPAGLVRIKHPQLIASGVGLANRVHFDGTSTVEPSGLPSYPETGNATSNHAGIIPAFYFAEPISDKLVFGIGATAPFGLGDDYSNSSVVRYDVTRIVAQSTDIGPSLAYKLTDKFSAALGVDALYFKLSEKSMARTEPLTGENDSSLAIEMAGWGYGWHGGLLYQFTPHTRVGLGYHSSIVDHLSGNSRFNGLVLPGGFNSSNNTQTTVHFPAITTLSLYHDITSAWAVMGTVDYTEWSVFKNEHVYNLASPNGLLTVNTPKDFHNTLHFALGTSYQFNKQWLLRTGADYDNTPTNDRDRDSKLPDADRIGIGVGTHYQATRDLGLDASYYHGFYRNAKLHYANTNKGITDLAGTVKSSVDAFGLQIEWNIA